jgi:hypothetical protein
MFTVPGPSSVNNDTRLLFDFTAVGRKQGEPRFSYSYRDAASCLALRRDPVDFIDKPLYGDYNSNVILLEQDERSTWDGSSYPFRVQTPHTNLGEFEGYNSDVGRFVRFSNRNKIFDNLEIEYIPYTDATVRVTVYVDGSVKQVIDALLELGGAPIGIDQNDINAFTLGESALAGGSVRSVVHRLSCGSGRRISLRFECTNADEDAAITHFFLGFRIGDTTQTPRR